MSERTQEVDYFQQYLPSAGSPSAPTYPGQDDVRAVPNQPQIGDEAEELTPEKYQAAIARAEAAEKAREEARTMGAREAEQKFQSNLRAQQAQQVWDQAAIEAKKRAAEMHPDDAIEYLDNFHQQRTAALKQEAENMFLGFAANSWSEKLIQDYKLEPDDMVYLRGRNPDEMQLVAQRIRAERDEREKRFKELEEKIGLTEVDQYVQQRVRSGAYQNAGGSGRQQAFDPATLSVRDHLRYALENGEA